MHKLQRGWTLPRNAGMVFVSEVCPWE